MTLTEILEQLHRAAIDCKYDIKADWTTHEEKLFLLSDLGQLNTAIAILKELKENGSDQFFSGCISK